MKRLLFVAATFMAWLPIFAIQKPLFMLYHRSSAQGCSPADWLQVIAHGLRLDCTVAGYTTLFPLLCAIASVWLHPSTALRTILRVYFALAAGLIALVFAADMALYAFWGFRMDATVLFYSQYPSQALGAIPVAILLRQGIVLVLYAAGIYYCCNRLLIPLLPSAPAERPLRSAAGLLACAAVLIVPIRGSVTTSTANVGMVYFSPRRFLNHAAINPTFSLFASLSKQQNFAAQFRFFPDAERDSIFRTLFPPPSDNPPPVADRPATALLRVRRPDILLIVLESFSANVIGALEGENFVTPCLNRLCSEGMLFPDFYASSFRTDRGLVALLNGYPAQPTTSVMKYPAKSQSLPSIAKVLADSGYQTAFVYGGDINFTNMRSYLYGTGFGRVVSDRDFPLAERLSKWGAGDNVTFPFLLRLLTDRRQGDAHNRLDVDANRLAGDNQQLAGVNNPFGSGRFNLYDGVVGADRLSVMSDKLSANVGNGSLMSDRRFSMLGNGTAMRGIGSAMRGIGSVMPEADFLMREADSLMREAGCFIGVGLKVVQLGMSSGNRWHTCFFLGGGESGGLGFPNGQLGNYNGALGNSNGQLGNPNGALGNPNGALGNPNGALGNPNGALGNPNGALGDPNGQLENSNGAIGEPQWGIGGPQRAIGELQRGNWGTPTRKKTAQ